MSGNVAFRGVRGVGLGCGGPLQARREPEAVGSECVSQCDFVSRKNGSVLSINVTG